MSTGPAARRRRGAIAPLVALLLIPLLAMIAFSVDIGYIGLAKQELQNAADAGALAAAQSLQSGYLQYNMSTNSSPISTYTDAATAQARATVQANSAGGRTLAFTTSTDIEYGYTNPSTGAYSSPTTNYPNTVTVRTRRDTGSGTPLRLFFAPVLGVDHADLVASARATLQTGTMEPNLTDLGLSGAANAGILPLTYNVNWWNNFLQTGQNPDGTAAATDANGTAYLVPFGGGGASNQLGQANWGWLSLSDAHVGASTLSGWVDSGMSSSDTAALQDASLLPLSAHDANTLPSNSSGPSGSWNWIGDNGAKVSVAHTINSYIGKTFLMPLYKPVPADATGLPKGVSPGDAGIGGSNKFYYNIVAFVPVKIINSGDNNSVSVAPSASFPPQAQFSNPQTADTSASSGTAPTPIFVTAKLTQ